MKRFLSLLIVLCSVAYFPVALNVGKEVVYSSKSVFLSYIEAKKIVNAVSFLLEYPPPKFVINKDYQAIIFNDRVLGYDGKDYILQDGKVTKNNLSVKELLDYFYIPYIQYENTVIIPSSFIESIKLAGVTLTVNYLGIPKLHYRVKDGTIEVVSTGYTFYAGDIYRPGEVIFKAKVGEFEVGKILEERGKDVVKLIKKGEEKKIMMIPYTPHDFSLIKPLPFGSIGVVIGRGRGVVIVRPTTPDLRGLDKEFFSMSKDIGEKLAKALGYNFEICPIKGIPPASSYILVVLENPDDYKKLPELLRRLSGIEKIVDFTTSYDQLFNFGY